MLLLYVLSAAARVTLVHFGTSKRQLLCQAGAVVKCVCHHSSCRATHNTLQAQYIVHSSTHMARAGPASGRIAGCSLHQHPMLCKSPCKGTSPVCTATATGTNDSSCAKSWCWKTTLSTRRHQPTSDVTTRANPSNQPQPLAGTRAKEKHPSGSHHHALQPCRPLLLLLAIAAAAAAVAAALAASTAAIGRAAAASLLLRLLCLPLRVAAMPDRHDSAAAQQDDTSKHSAQKPPASTTGAPTRSTRQHQPAPSAMPASLHLGRGLPNACTRQHKPATQPTPASLDACTHLYRSMFCSVALVKGRFPSRSSTASMFSTSCFSSACVLGGWVQQRDAAAELCVRLTAA